MSEISGAAEGNEMLPRRPFLPVNENDFGEEKKKKEEEKRRREEEGEGEEVRFGRVAIVTQPHGVFAATIAGPCERDAAHF